MAYTKKRDILNLNNIKLFRMIRLIVFFLLLSINICTASNSYSQNTVISLNVKDKTIKEVFSEIEKKSKYVFFYYENLIDLNRKVSLNVKDQTLPDILNQLFEKTSNAYSIDDRQVYITQDKKQAKPDKATLRIEGSVKDTNGDPLIGVTVQELGTNNITVTDADGKYTLYNIKSEASVIKFTYIGFNPKEVKVEKQNVIDVVLLDDTQGLEEVVVVGYGTQKRESVIGAITTINPSNLQVNQSRSVTNALAGQVAGIIAVQRSGEPGNDASDFWIRGISTFGAATGALVLVDGIERSLSNISPEEIESFSVLKDATATAVYGVRGANGVVLIQTKRGQIGKPRVTVKADYGVSAPTQLPKFVDGPTFMEATNEAFRLSATPNNPYKPHYSLEAIEATRNRTDPDLYPDVNWLDAVSNSYVPNGRVSLDINGGSERLRYSMVVAAYTEKGVTVTDKNTAYDSANKLSRYNVRANVDVDLTPSTTVGVSIGGYIMNIHTPGWTPSDILNRALKTNPIAFPILYSNGQIPAVGGQENPWAMATNSGFISTFQNSLQSVFTANQNIGKLYQPLEGLSAKVTFSFDAYSYTNTNRKKEPQTFLASLNRNEDGSLNTLMTSQGQNFLPYSKGSGGNRAMYFEGQLSYSKLLDQKHRIDALLLYNMRDYLADAGDALTSIPYRTQGFAGRLSYGFKDTYFIESNFGYNGSENFAKGHRFGFFPSIAAGWMISNEPFMAGLSKTISKLKLRGSYGLVGNDQISGRRFAYLATIISGNDPANIYSDYAGNVRGNYVYGLDHNNNIPSLLEGDFENMNMSWEIAKKADLGLELGLWNGGLNIQADVFQETRSGIFMQRKIIPQIVGYFKAPYANFGVVDNRGFEINMDANKRLSKDWSVAARGTFTYAHNKFVEVDEAEVWKNTPRSQTGGSINRILGYEAIGLYQEQDFNADGTLIDGIPVPKLGTYPKAGDIRYADICGPDGIPDGIVNSYDQTTIGKTSVPEIVYGLGLSATYKNFDLSIFLQGATSFSGMMSSAYNLIPGSGGGGDGNIYSNWNDRWTPEDPYKEVFWPRLSSVKNLNNTEASTWWLYDASYVRMKNLELGYTIPKKWQKAALMRDARLFFRGTNLFTWSVFKMWDPEIGSGDGMKYPPMKVYSLGFQVTF
jgi:TonB-linked SusC/RagA family outer membrane protein